MGQIEKYGTNREGVTLQGHLPVVEWLAAKYPGAATAPDVCDQLPIHHAARAGHLEVVRFFCAQDNTLVQSKDLCGRQPADLARVACKSDVQSWLDGQISTRSEAAADTAADQSFVAAVRRLAVAKLLHPRLAAESPSEWLPINIINEFTGSRTMSDMVVLVGGLHKNKSVSSVLVLDETLCEWKMLPDLPRALHGGMCSHLRGGGVFYAGGVCNPDGKAGKSPQSGTYVLRPVTQDWEIVAEMPTARTGGT
eukprot:SAG31_NODE_3922_length_3749_cov_4.089315_5_plen_251_part_01